MSGPTKRFSEYIDVILDLDLMWGHAVLGLELTQGFYDGYGVTADSLASRLRISDDTARRWLEQAARTGKAWVKLEGHRRSYYATAKCAEYTVNRLRGAEKYHPQLAVINGLRD